MLPEEIGPEDRATLVALDGARWAAVRAEAARVLDTLERSEVRDAEVAAVRAGVAGRMGGDLSAAEVALAATLIRPLVVPNSSFSAEQTELERVRAAGAVPDAVKSWERNETIVRRGDRVDEVAMEAVERLGLNTGGLDPVRLVGFVLLTILVVGLLLSGPGGSAGSSGTATTSCC